MKRILMLCAALYTLTASFGQDTTGKKAPDTIKVGGMVIIREHGDVTVNNNVEVNVEDRKRGRKSDVTTNWFILDLGFSNYTDKTDYAAAAAINAVAPGIGKDQMALRTWKSRNVNIWFFMQRVNLIKHVVNFKYGFGLELNNYFYDDKSIRFQKNADPLDPFIIQDPAYATSLKKNKLAADYLTVPFMLDLNFTPDRHRPYGISAGVSIGYLYSARQKTKANDNDVKKTKGIDLDEWKLSYVAEVSLGTVIHVYGSYALESMFDKKLDMTPYTVGIRFSNW